MTLRKRFCIALEENKILDWSKLKAFADSKINVNEKLKFGLQKEENFIGKGENNDNQHFLLFYNVFKSPLFQGR